MFLVIACKPSASPYLGALLPKDQAFEDEAEARKETPAKKANLGEYIYKRIKYESNKFKMYVN